MFELYPNNNLLWLKGTLKGRIILRGVWVCYVYSFIDGCSSVFTNLAVQFLF